MFTLTNVVRCSRCFSSCRVVVTGLGLVCPLGVGVSCTWKRLLEGRVGISRLDEVEYENIPSQVAAFVPRGSGYGELNLEKEFDRSLEKKLSLSAKFGLIAAQEALKDADWSPVSRSDLESTGVAIGTGMVDLSDIVSEGNTLKNNGYSKVSPHFVTRILTNMIAGHVSIRYGFRGPNHSVSTACATGAHSVGDAYNFIKYGHASVMVCGAADAVISPLSVAAFSRIRALSTHFNSDPEKASRPFDKSRDGFVMGEGAGILVLESLDHALERSAKIYAEILGYGLSGDAYHVAAPSLHGDGAYLCMKAALEKCRCNSDAVGYINAHGTSTPQGDITELRAIQKLFNDHTKTLLVSSTKGATGHLLGAAGSVEAIFTVLACNTGYIPPTANLDDCDVDTDINVVAKHPVLWPESDACRIGMTNSFGFGGTNVSLVFSSFNH